MKEIKSKKAKSFILNIVEPIPTPNGELVFYVEMTALQVVESIIIAEQEADERHSKDMQELRDMAVEAFKSACSCGKEAGIGRKCERFTDCARYKMFTQKLTEL